MTRNRSRSLAALLAVSCESLKFTPEHRDRSVFPSATPKAAMLLCVFCHARNSDPVSVLVKLTSIALLFQAVKKSYGRLLLHHMWQSEDREAPVL